MFAGFDCFYTALIKLIPPLGNRPPLISRRPATAFPPRGSLICCLIKQLQLFRAFQACEEIGEWCRSRNLSSTPAASLLCVNEQGRTQIKPRGAPLYDFCYYKSGYKEAAAMLCPTRLLDSSGNDISSFANSGNSSASTFLQVSRTMLPPLPPITLPSSRICFIS